MRPSNGTRWIGTLAMLVVPAWAERAASFEAGASIPIQVEHLIEVAEMSNAWPQSRRETIRTEIAGRLAQELSNRERLKHWVFDPAAQNAPVVFSFRIVQELTNEIRVTLRFTRQGTVVKEWKEVWMKPGDLGLKGWPPPANAVPEVSGIIVGSLLTPEYEAQIHDALKQTVPVAVGAQWLRDGEPRIVLPLPWQKYRLLSESRFRVACQAGQGTDELTAEAQGKMERYTPPPPDSPYDGLLVIPLARKRAPLTDPDLRNLDLKFVYLEEYTPPSLWEWEVFQPMGNQP